MKDGDLFGNKISKKIISILPKNDNESHARENDEV